MKRARNALNLALSYAGVASPPIRPILIELELTNRCGQGCVMCPNSRMTRARGDMDLALLRQIVDQSADTAWEYSLDFLGEPTLHPGFLDAVALIKRAGGRVALYTNLHVADERLIDELVYRGVDKVVVTLHGTDPASYRVLSPHGDLPRVLAALARLRRARARTGGRRPHVVLSVIRTRENDAHLKAIVAEAARHGDQVTVSEIHDWVGRHELSGLSVPGAGSSKGSPCSRLWTTAAILWDGRVAACCYDFDGAVVLGDLRVESLPALWSSPRMKRFRRQHRDNPLCAGCADADAQFTVRNIVRHLRSW